MHLEEWTTQGAVRSGDADLHPVVVADDDPAIVHLLQEDLLEVGCRVFGAYDGQMAVRLVRERHPHLIILDVNMPMTSGLKAFEYLRASEETAKIPVIFITGELSKDIYPVIAAASRVAHVKKPLDLENFNSLVQQFLSDYPMD